MKTCDELVERYEMHQQQQNEMLRQQVLQNYQQYPPPTEHRHPQGTIHILRKHNLGILTPPPASTYM